MLAIGGEAPAVSPDSPEVKKLIAAGLSYLERPTTDVHANQLGGKCLIGLAFLKASRADHARVAEALEACRATMRANPPDSALDVYSNGLAIIFLSEVSSQTHAREIEWYLNRLKARQKPHGGWGYPEGHPGHLAGDTSQTQYAALCYWEAHRRGFNIQGDSLESLADWLLRTQDPDGCWGYHGQVSKTGELIKQEEKNCSMLAAGLGIAYICADLLDMNATAAADEPVTHAADTIPAALRPVGAADTPQPAKKIRARRIKAAQLTAAMDRAHAWMEKNYKIDIGPKRFYYLYGLERYKSFQEVYEGAIQQEPQWYKDGYEYLAEYQGEDGSWSGFCGAPCDTAFSILFLLRSTQKSLRANLGEGTLLAGRGLPTNLSRAKMRNGQLIVEQVHTKVDELLSMIDDDEGGRLDELASDPSQLVIEKVDPQSARRLQQLVRGGEPEVRLLAVRALARTGNLDYVPSLLYALTDPDRRIVLEARNGLRFISRNFDGFGPPDDFTDQQRFDALEAWKKWYQSLRPAAMLGP